ncbi:hypothetical protein E4P39_09025 [Blastococcus sp. CT_GayMR19]|uniref:hypothetical protein n=1 Tax=Blastococcus sp. CT_GayMR19 TaxID=2559608 RepID=UPI001073D0E0|nr:hypothetical protein [Blastococcus sp. CT_GayMR19]TFV76026.1 hypothetical protein E4P39_09025 [Blastococcus sp. CT_GayMR19]
MDSYTLYVALRADRCLDDAAVAAVGAPLRPDDEDLCIWRDADAPAVLRVSADCLAADLEAALELGHALAAETQALGPGLAVEEVVAMTDDEQLVWRARP